MITITCKPDKRECVIMQFTRTLFKMLCFITWLLYFDDAKGLFEMYTDIIHVAYMFQHRNIMLAFTLS